MEEVDIVFESQALRAKFGVKPRRVTVEVAQNYERKGWAKIISSIPVANPAPQQSFFVPVAEEAPDPEKVSFMPEERLLDQISWITSFAIKKPYGKYAEDAGLKFKVVRPDSFSAGDLVLSKLIILSSDLSAFPEEKKRHIRALLFQKRIPYIYRIEKDFLEIDPKWSKQAIVGARAVIFISKEIYKSYEEALGDIIGEPFIEKGMVGFWRKVNEVLKGIHE